MAGRSLFGRDDESKGDAAPRGEGEPSKPEGVRLIEPDKAAEVAEKGTTAKRRGGDIPKYGDRPEPPATDKKAAIRLPLSGSTDLNSIERPKPAPVTRPRADGSVGASPTQVSIGAPTVGTGEVAAVSATPPPEPPPSPGADPSRRKRRKARKEEKSAQEELVPADPLELERVDPLEPKKAADPKPSSSSKTPPPAPAVPPAPAPASGTQPVLAVEPPSGEVAMPHWTEPATGEVPKVIVGDTPSAEDDQAAWDSFAGTTAPRYRDQHDTWDDTSITDLLDDDSSGRLGALAPSDDDLQTQDEFLTLEDVDMPDIAMPKPPTRGSVQDPVRQGKAGLTTGSTPVVRPTKKASARPSRGPEERTRRAPERSGRPTGENKTVSERLGVAAPQPSDRGERNLSVAIPIGIVMGLAAWALFAWLPPSWKWIGMVVITAVIFLSGAELLAAVSTRRFKPVLPVAWAALIALPVASYTSGEVAIPLILFLTVLFSFLWYVLGLATEKPLGNLAVTFFAVLWVGVFGSFAALLYRIGPVLIDGSYEENQGPSILIMAIVVAVASDAGALGWGKLYGRRTFTPISPNKTIEGLIGGVLTAVVITTIAGVKFGPFGVAGTAFFALACAVAAPVGDLAESLVKRDIGLKDMSDLIPGHGGVLDRFDALLFVLPVAYFVTRLLLPGIPWF
ncbi:MAG: phosphatidate cytidylyltransferase [Actinobacteria bacterium]|nr:phosphatidate cytidylyltransferase [Actinomycetota bacterium]